jgi:Asp-tRNA(Asn)/Glu-tRNA(Gln) amidotransferase A subunit family amidase
MNVTLPKPELLDETRRRFISISTAVGISSTLFPSALLALATDSAEAQSPPPAGSLPPVPTVTAEMVAMAADLAAIKVTPEQVKMMLPIVNRQRNQALQVRDQLNMPNSVAPVLVFNPIPPGTPGPTPAPRQPVVLGPAPSIADISSSQEEKIAFATIRQLGELLRQHKITSLELTNLYLTRLKRYDPTLYFYINLTEERARTKAAAADRELAAGKDRGPLHGIPWGAKDLIAVAGYPTTWGAGGMEDQRFDEDAEIVKRLDAAGAVLIAKLASGVMAQGDIWGGAPGSGKPGGRVRNPWNPQQGSSGSSAGPGSATSAGCVGFAIGTETGGSIIGPSTRCGVTGMRPSFGLVPRTGIMALTWSMDKIGPITRSVEDCALVLNVIYGTDGMDMAMLPAPFFADLTADIHALRVGYLASTFQVPTLQPLSAEQTKDLSAAERAELEQQNRTDFENNSYDVRFATRALETLRDMGIKLTPTELPNFDWNSIRNNTVIIEAAAAFEYLTLNGRDALLPLQGPTDWPNEFRVSHLLSAVDYIQAQRARSFALAEMYKLFSGFDVIIAANGGPQLTATNLCGQPGVAVPNGLRGPDAPPYVSLPNGREQGFGGPGTPVALNFIAPLYKDGNALLLAHAYQQKTGFHLLHPKL